MNLTSRTLLVIHQKSKQRKCLLDLLVTAFGLLLLASMISGCSRSVSPKLAPDRRPVVNQRMAVQRQVLPAPELALTPEVERELKKFSSRNSQFVEAALQRRAAYYEIIKQIFVDEGVPEELLNVAIIESGFRPEAKSPVGALGIWQFMKSTARVYGLEVSRNEDQRRDPILSSIAAARHLRDLYIAYQDWNLALAAYNAGSGGIDRAINRAGTRDFWELARRGKLRTQTKNYVARFTAVSLMLKEPDKYFYDLPSTLLVKREVGVSDDNNSNSQNAAHESGLAALSVG